MSFRHALHVTAGLSMRPCKYKYAGSIDALFNIHKQRATVRHISNLSIMRRQVTWAVRTCSYMRPRQGLSGVSPGAARAARRHSDVPEAGATSTARRHPERQTRRVYGIQEKLLRCL